MFENNYIKPASRVDELVATLFCQVKRMMRGFRVEVTFSAFNLARFCFVCVLGGLYCNIYGLIILIV